MEDGKGGRVAVGHDQRISIDQLKSNERTASAIEIFDSEGDSKSYLYHFARIIVHMKFESYHSRST